MPSILVGSPLFSGHLLNQHVYSSNPALATFIRVTAGHTRSYWELLIGGGFGAAPMADQSPCIAPNPLGYFGEIHAGAGYGAPIKHSLFNKSWPDAQGGPSYATADNRLAPNVYRDFSNTGEVTGFDRQLGVYIPGCFDGGPYETCRAEAVIQVVIAKSGEDAYLRIYTPAQGGGAGGDTVDSSSLKLTFSTTSTGYVRANGTLRVIPGQINRMRFKLSIPYSAGGGSCHIRLVNLGLLQVTSQV